MELFKVTTFVITQLLLITSIYSYGDHVHQYEFEDDGGENFCRFVQSKSEIDREQRVCQGCETLTKPLYEMRECCDKQSGERLNCLKKLRDLENEVDRLFLSWNEREGREEEYLTHLSQCLDTYKDKFDQRVCSGNDADRCIDLVGKFETHCKDKNLAECQERFLLSVKTSALSHFCANDHHDGVTDFIDNHKTTHYKCFDQQALTKYYEGVRSLQRRLNDFCVLGRYGRESDIVTYQQKMFYKQFNMLDIWDQGVKQGYERERYGVLDEFNTNAESYLENLCIPDDKAPRNIWEHSAQNCMETPITENFITFQNVDSMETVHKSCCRNSNNGKDKDTLKKCLVQAHMFEQFYPMGGLHVRSIFRTETGFMTECASKSMLNEGKAIEMDDVSNDEIRAQYYDMFKPDSYAAHLKLNTTINTINYHFFMREIVQEVSQNDEYYMAACEACAAGENLGYQAYAFPGLMCPGLVSEMYYSPNRMLQTCPDMLFFKSQVANYCCLRRAVSKYSLGLNWDSSECPNLSDFSYKVVP